MYLWYNYKEDLPGTPPRFMHAMFNIEVAVGELSVGAGVCGDGIRQNINSLGMYEVCDTGPSSAASDDVGCGSNQKCVGFSNRGID